MSVSRSVWAVGALFVFVATLRAAAGDVCTDEPDGVLLWTEAPRALVLDEPVTLEVTIENVRDDRGFFFEDIDVDWDYVKGFEFIRAQPPPQNVR